MKNRLMYAVLATFIMISLTPQSVPATWRFEWQTDSMTDKVSCVAFSDHKYFKTGYGQQKDSVYIGIHDSGQVSLHSKKSPFSTRLSENFGLRIDKNQAIFAPQKSFNSNTVVFDKEKSAKLLQQFATGNSIMAQIVFFPKNKPVKNTFSLENYIPAMSQYNACQAIKNSEGWVGVYLFEMQPDEWWLSWLEKHKDYSAGTMIITIDPRKQGYKDGLRSVDVILSFNNKPASSASLIDALNSLKAGKSIDLEVLKNNKVKKVKLTRPVL